jgi:hypothetical protein
MTVSDQDDKREWKMYSVVFMPFCIHEIMNSLRRTFPVAEVSNYKSGFTGDDEIRCSAPTVDLEGHRDGSVPHPNYLLKGVFIGTLAEATGTFESLFDLLKSFQRRFQFEIYDDQKEMVHERINV